MGLAFAGSAVLGFPAMDERIAEMKRQALERGRGIPNPVLSEEDSRIEGLGAVLEILKRRGYSDRVATGFLLLEQETEEGALERPIDLLRAGRIEEAARMAERYGETGA